MKFELFADAAHTENVSLKIGDVVPKDKWIFKANWIDSTHLRNVLCYNLWQKVMATRSGWPRRDIDNSYVGSWGPAPLIPAPSAARRGTPACCISTVSFTG